MSFDPGEKSEIFVKSSAGNRLELAVSGRLDFSTVEDFWEKTNKLIKSSRPLNVSINCARITYCDTLGIVYFIKLKESSVQNGFEYEISNLSDEFQI